MILNYFRINFKSFSKLSIFETEFITRKRRDGTNRFMKGVTQLDFSNNSISDLSALPMACKMLRGKVNFKKFQKNSKFSTAFLG